MAPSSSSKRALKMGTLSSSLKTIFNRKDCPDTTPSAVQASATFQSPPLQQEQSPFLTKLPLEIRTEIYKHVFGSTSIHIIGDRRLSYVKCLTNSQDDLWHGHRECMEGLGEASATEDKGSRLFAICHTCRRV